MEVGGADREKAASGASGACGHFVEDIFSQIFHTFG